MMKHSRFIAFLLATVFILSAPGPIGVVSVQAAENLNFMTTYNETLTEGTLTSAPTHVQGNLRADEILNKWDFSRMGVYYLRYYIDNNKQAVFRVTKTSDVAAEVSYRIFTSTGSALQLPSYTISDFGRGYVPYNQFTTTNPGWNVLIPSPATPVTIANFNLAPNTGFSIMYDSRRVQFLWNQNTFYVTTDRVDTGRIYDFNLYYNPDATLTAAGGGDVTVPLGVADRDKTLPDAIDLDNDLSGSQKIMMGIRGFESKPIANALLPDPADEGKTNLSYPTDGWPGSDIVKLKLSFDIPLVWDERAFAFATMQSSASFPDLTLRLQDSQSSDIININFKDITGAVTCTLSGSGGTLAGSPTSTGTKIQVTLTDLKAGQIFDATTLQLTNLANTINDGVKDVNFQLRMTSVEYGKVYTYPNYIIRPVDDQFYVFIEPYKGHNGYYLLKINDRVISQSDESNGSSMIILPATGTINGIPNNYQVFFSTGPFHDNGNPTGTNLLLTAQSVTYTATLNDTTISSPNNFKVLSYEQRFTQSNTDKSELYITLAWDIGKLGTLQNLIKDGETLDIIYELNRTWTPGSDDGQNPFATLKMSIKRTGDEMRVTYSDTEGKVVPEEKALDYYTDSISGLRVYQAQVKLKLTAARSYDFYNDIYFVFPGIYFLNVKPVEIDGEPEIYLSASLYDSITLNAYEVPSVPAPQNIQAGNAVTLSAKADGIDRVSFDVNWSTPIDGLREYLKYLYLGSNDPITESAVTYNLYISQSETHIKNFALQDRGARHPQIADYLPAGGNTLYASQINGIGDDMFLTTIDNKELREALRNPASVIGITGIPMNDPANSIDDVMNLSITSGSSLSVSYTLDGLDKNQQYYVCVETVVEPPAGDVEGTRYSQLSSIPGETTKGDPDILDPTNSDPPAPYFKNDEKQVDKVTAILPWDRITENLSAPIVSINYQVIRTKDRPLDDVILDNTSLKFDEIWQSGMLGFETAEQDLEVNTNGSFVPVTDDEFYDLDTSSDPPTLRLVDKTLTTNSIYYYYIRTVRTALNADQQPVTRHSKWTGISLTTSPVQPPINLKVEQDRTDFDRYTEAIISFDAPITDVSTLGTEYNLIGQLKRDDDEWGNEFILSPSLLTVSDSPIQGYKHFTYKITGLSPNTLYSVRVRIQDLINNDFSAYTKVEPIKTEFRQEDYDNEQSAGNWLDYLTEMLEKLVKDPYWISRDTSGLFEVVYRPTMFGPLLAQNPGGLLQLVESKSEKAVYYLPASAVIAANDSNVGFKIVYDDMDVILSPKSVDTNYNNAIINITEKIKEKSIDDYYVRITLTRAGLGSLVEGEQALTKQANIQVETIGSRDNITKWDKNMLAKLAAKVAAAAGEEAIKKEVLQAIEDNASGEELVKLVADIANDVKQDFIKEISSELSKTIRHSYNLDYLDAPLILVAKGLDPAATVKAYQLISGSYISYEVTNFGDNKAVYTSSPGVYVFAGRVILVPGLENLQGAGSLGGIIGKYGLDDFFGKDGAFSLEAFATRQQVVGSIARMAGAPNGAEPFAWLSQNKGLSISSRNSNGSIQAQEAVYLVMALYESRTGTRIATIQIRNFSLTAGMTGLSENYKQSVRAAFELGICNSSGFNPASNIKVKEILEILGNLDAKSRL